MKARLLFLFVIFFIRHLALAQSLPQGDYNWQTEADYRQYEDEVLATIEWLEENPIATTDNDTKAMTAFVLAWLAGVPYITVTYNDIFLESIANSKKYRFAEKFRVTYLLGKAYYYIKHPDNPDEAEACARGITGMVKVYEELKKVDPSVQHWRLEKYSRLYHNGKLLTYVRRQLSKEENPVFY